jgi:3-hydroxyacyl-[acyl-carrier-protein] dehydratase
MQMDAKEIQRHLPHRYPFLFVDRILEVVPGARAIGLKNVTINEEFFSGHFPGRPMMPGVLVLEFLAQVGGVLLNVSADNHGRFALFGGMDRVRFRRPVVPGDQLIGEVHLTTLHADFGKIKGVARVEGEIAAEAEYSFVFVQDDERDSAEVLSRCGEG